MLRFDRLRRARLKARLALLWEQAAMPLMGPALAIGLYLSLALYGVFERLGDPWRLITLVSTPFQVPPNQYHSAEPIVLQFFFSPICGHFSNPSVYHFCE